MKTKTEEELEDKSFDTWRDLDYSTEFMYFPEEVMRIIKGVVKSERKKAKEEFMKKLEELKEKSYPVHFCETKKCKCYNPKAKENNAIIIELEEIDKIFKEGGKER